MVFAQKLRVMREERGLTQRQISDALQISFRAYQGYESGKYPKDQRTLQRIASYFEVSIDSLLSDEDNFVVDMQTKYGSRAAQQAQGILAAAEALYAGGKLTDEDEEAFRAHMMRIFERAKETNRARRAAHGNKPPR